MYPRTHRCCLLLTPGARMHFFKFYQLAAVLAFLQHAQITVALPSKRALFVPNLTQQPSSIPPELHKRLNNQWQSFLAPDGWKVSYITFAHFIPIQMAAFGLQGLYQAVMVHAVANQMTEQTPSNAIVITIGNFTLTLASNQKIPWALLQAFAARMWTVTGMGFTPGYTMSFVSPSGTILRANLRVSERGEDTSEGPSAPAPQG